MTIIKNNKEWTLSDLRESLGKIYDSIVSNDFLSHKGLWNEIPFYIYDYPAKYELLVRNSIKTLISKINRQKPWLNVIEIDLYDIMIEIMNDTEDWLLEYYFELEKTKGDAYLKKYVTPSIDDFNSKIKERAKDKQIIFLTWVWKIYPLLRSHTILNNLHHVIPWTNLIMFFPWEYTKTELRLFSKLKDDNYYRAFSLNTSI